MITFEEIKSATPLVLQKDSYHTENKVNLCEQVALHLQRMNFCTSSFLSNSCDVCVQGQMCICDFWCTSVGKGRRSFRDRLTTFMHGFFKLTIGSSMTRFFALSLFTYLWISASGNYVLRCRPDDE